MIQKIKNKILEIIKANVPLIIATVIIIATIIIVGRGAFPLGITNRGGGGGGGGIMTVTTSTLDVADNDSLFLVRAPAILSYVTIGEAGSGQVALYDSTAFADNDIDSLIFFATASDAQSWPLDYVIKNGIMINTTDQARVRLFYTPME